MRVLGRGGGTGRPRGRPGRGCLAQRGELERRVNGAPHQLAERALGRATGDRRGEHAFVKLRRWSDGNGSLQGFLQRFRREPAALRGRPESGAGEGRLGSPPWAARTPTASASATANATPQGVVFNAHYFAYFDLALTELWREAAGGYARDDGGGRRPPGGRGDGPLQGARALRRRDRRDDRGHAASAPRAWSRATRSTATARCSSRASSRYVFVDATALTKVPIPERFRAALAG